MKQLLECGIHFGHQTRRWNPKMGRYIFGERHGIYIIDLQKTMRQMSLAYKAVRDIAAEGGNVLFVGTKKQASDSVRDQAKRCNMFYINNRWLGGTLTNWQTIQKSIGSLTYLQELESSGKIESYTKKEAIVMRKKREKLESNLAGVQTMGGTPQAIFVVDSYREDIAIREATRLGIKTIAICDTNSDPDVVDIPIPGNDDAIRAIDLFCGIMADAVIDGRMRWEKKQAEEAAKAGKGGDKTVQSSKLAKQQAKVIDPEATADTAEGEEVVEAEEAEVTTTPEAEPVEAAAEDASE
jgi:small subunit ribosomal protein S2